MQQKITHSEAVSHPGRQPAPLLKFFTRVCLCIFLMSFVPLMAGATHFRFGSITATRLSETLTTATYRLNVSLSWRLGTAPSAIPFTISGGNSGSVSVPMTTVTDPSGIYDNSTGSLVVTFNKTTTLTRIEFTGFNKLTTIANNANTNWDVYTLINTGAPGSTPVSTLPAIINMPVGQAAATYNVPASDPDPGSTLTFGTPPFTGALAAEGEPTGFAINSSNGQITFNTTSATIGQQYNALITVTDNDGNMILLDFLINIVSPSAPPQFDYAVTPPNGTIYNILVGQNIAFPIQATNPGSGTTVDLSVSGLPSYITTSNFTPAFPATGNPSRTNFNWTPAAPQLGSTVILNFIATNNLGIQTSSSVQVNVVAEPAPLYTASTPADGSIRSVLAGVPVNDTITAMSSIGSNVSVAYASVPSGGTTTPSVPTTGSNPGQTIFNWIPPSSAFGVHHLSFESIISAYPTIFSTLHYDLIVDDLPVFASVPDTTVQACAVYSYSVVANDANIPYGDTVEITAESTLPSWLTLTLTGNGTAVLSGTPTSADAGTYSITLGAEDLYHHNYSPIEQTFNIVVTANNISGLAEVCVGSQITVSNGVMGGTWSSSNTNAAIDATTGVVTGIAAGTANITYSVGTGCTATTNVTVNGLPAVSSISGATSVCMGTTTTLANTTSGGLWSSSDPSVATIDFSTGDYTGVAAGTSAISYTVTNAQGCINAASTVISVDPVYAVIASAGANGNISPSGTSNVCLGNNQVYTITPDAGYHVDDVLVDGGSAGSVTTYIFTAVNAAHSIHATFAADCVPPVVTCAGDVTVNSDPSACGAIVTYAPATATGTAPSVTYSQASGTSFPVGTTMVIATANNGCGTHTCSFYVNVIDNEAPSVTAPGTVTVNADAGQCSALSVALGMPVVGDNCGIASVSNNAAPPFAVGTTIVTWTVTDIHGNVTTASQSVTVTDNQVPTITAPAPVAVNNDAGACSAASVSLGTPLAGDNCGIATITNNALPPFVVGTSTVVWTVTDVNGLSSTATQTVTVTDNEAPVITAPADKEISGYCSPVSVSLGTPVTHDNCGVALVSNDAPALFPVGTTIVTWTVTDIHGNAATATQRVTITGSISLSATVNNVTCNGAADGSISTSITGGTSPYSYVWSNGATTPSVSGLVPGTYTVTVNDAHDCGAGGIYTITQPSALSLAGGVATNIKCFGAADGSIVTNVAGGTPGYSYTWSTGATTANLTGLTPGTYSVTVTDAHSCRINSTYSITQPSTALTLTATKTNANCYGGTGTITTVVSGGVAPYSYLWSNGATTANITAVAGTYSVTVTDANGCVRNGAYTITQPSEPFVFDAEIDNVSCNGGSNGHIDADVDGGSWPYFYSWKTGGKGIALGDDLFFVPAGTYTVSVTDAKGCTITSTFTITEPPAISVSAVVTNASCYNSCDGNINTTVTGGTPPYNYLWSNGSRRADPTGLCAGSYVLTVWDANGCSKTVSYTVTQPGPVTGTVSVSPVYPVTGGAPYTIYLVYGVQSETLTATPTSGTPSYTYSWSSGLGSSPTAVVSPTVTTTYTVTITDANGCKGKVTQTINVEEIRCNGDGKGKDHDTPHKCIYMCHNGHTVMVDSSDVAMYLSMGYSLDRCHGHRSSAPVSSEQVNEVASVKVYPNPADDVVNIEIPVSEKDAVIQLTDIAGRVLDTRIISDNDGSAIQLPVGNSAPGIYFIRVRTANGSSVEKIMKK